MAVRVEPVRRRVLAPLVSTAGATRASLRRLREDGAVVAAVLAVVAITGFLFAAVPRAVNRAADDALRHTVAEAGPLQSDIQVQRAMRIEAGPAADPFAAVAAEGERFEGSLGSLAGVVGERSFVVDSPRYEITGGPPLPGTTRYVTLHQATGALDHVALAEGRLPRPVDATERVRVGSVTIEARVFEIALSRAAAALLNVGAGERLVMSSDAEDPLVRGIALEDRSPLVLRVTGLFEPDDPSSVFWRAQPQLDEPFVEETPDRSHRWIYSLGVFAPEAYEALLGALNPMPLQFAWRYGIDSERLDGVVLPELEEDVRRLQARYGRQIRPGETYVRTGLPALFERHRAERDLSATLFALVEIGLLAVALTVVGMLAALIAARRSGTIALARARGASAAQVLVAQAAEGLLLAVPVGLAAYLLALLLVDGRGAAVSAVAVAAVVGAAVALLVALSARPARRTVPLETREEPVFVDVSRRRLALEGLVVLAALVGVYLLRRRGLDAGGTDAGGVDLYLVAVPVLLGLAVGIVVVRLYPLPLGALARAAAARRDLVPVLGTRRVARRPGATGVAVLTLVLAVGVAVFAAVETHAIERGRALSAWEQVGADIRVDAEEGSLPPEALEAARRSGAGVAEAWVADARVPTGSGTRGGLTLLAVEPDAYRRVVEGAPAPASLPPAEGAPVGAVLSEEPPQGVSVETGERFTVVVGGSELELAAFSRADSLAGLPAGQPFAVVPLDAARAAFGEGTVRVNRLYVRGGRDGSEAIREAAPSAAVLSRAEVERRAGEAPLAAATVDGFRAAAVAAAAFAALAIVLAVALTSRSRARDLTTLRALGVSPRQALAVTAIEIVPPVLLAVAVGIGLGFAVAHLVAPGVDLAAFTGARTVPDLALPLAPVLLLAAGLVLGLALAVLAAGAAARRVDLSRVLRAEER
jgi:putative ABC transport system permease protein